MCRDYLLQGLTEQQVAKLSKCKNQEEVLTLAKAEGVELTDEQLNTVSGGDFCLCPQTRCPDCNGTNVEVRTYNSAGSIYYCKKCKKEFTLKSEN